VALRPRVNSVSSYASDVLYHLGLGTILKYNPKKVSQYAFDYVYVVSIPKNKKFKKKVHSISKIFRLTAKYFDRLGRQKKNPTSLIFRL